MAKLGGMNGFGGASAGSMPSFFGGKTMPGPGSPVVNDWKSQPMATNSPGKAGVLGGGRSKPSFSPFKMAVPGDGRGIA